MQKPTTSDPSFKNFIEGLKNTNVSAVEPRPVQVGQLQPESDVVGSQTEGLNTLYREEKDANKEQKEFYKLQKQHNLIQENQFKQIVKSLENLNKLFSAKADVENKKDGVGKEGKLDYKGLPDQAKDLTYSEVLKQGVAKVKGVGSSVKSMGKSIVSAFKDPKSAVKGLYSNVKSSTKSMVENVKDIASTKEDYTPEQERFATAYAASEEGLSEKGSETDKLNAGKTQYDALKAKEDDISAVKGKMDVPTSQGFSPLKDDVKELTKLESDFASIDPRVKKEEVLNNKVNTEVVKKERESEVTGGVGADKPVTVNQESDNVVSAPEAVAEGTKADLEVSKQLLETTREQLTVLKEIKEALSPETPNELTEQKSAPSATEKEKEPGILDSLPNIDVDLPDRRKRSRRNRGKGVPKGIDLPDGKGVPKGIDLPGVDLPDGKGVPKGGLGSRIMGGIKGIGGKLGGLGGIAKGAAGVLGKLAVPLAVATAGYDAYKGVERAGENFDLKEGEEATLGQKTSSALGSVASGFSFGMVDEKAAAQGINKAGSAVKDFFGFGGDEKDIKAEAKPAETVAGKKESNAESNEAEAKPAETAAGKKGSSGAEGQADDQKLIDEFVKVYPPSEGFTYEGNLTRLNIFDKEGKLSYKEKIGKKLKTMDAATFAGLAMNSGGPTAKTEAEDKPAETAAGKKDVVPKETVDGKKAEYAGDIKATNTEAKLKVFGKGGSKEYSSFEEMGKALKNKEITPTEHRNAIKFFQKDNPEAYQKELERREKKDVTAEAKPAETAAVVPAKTTPVGANVARTSTENADMGREASKGGANNTVVSNNVSTNNTTTHVPIKATPRAESQGSALDRYQNRVSSFG